MTEAQKPMKASLASQMMRGCLGGSSIFSDRKLYYHRPSVSHHVRALLHVYGIAGATTHRSEPRVVPDKGSSSRRKGAPPQAADAVLLDTPAEQGRAPRPLGLHCGLEGVDGGQDHAERRGAKHIMSS
jgi:hypothetical protein